MDWLFLPLRDLLVFSFENGLEVLQNLPNLFFSLLISFGLIYWMFLQYKLNKKALIIAISGGPSTGKNILSKSIVDLLGNHSTLELREKDYFKWNKNLSNTKTIGSSLFGF